MTKTTKIGYGLSGRGRPIVTGRGAPLATAVDRRRPHHRNLRRRRRHRRRRLLRHRPITRQRRYWRVSYVRPRPCWQDLRWAARTSGRASLLGEIFYNTMRIFFIISRRR